MRELTSEDVAVVFDVPYRTAQRWVAQWAREQSDSHVPRVRKGALDSRRWRFLVEAESLVRRYRVDLGRLHVEPIAA